MSLTLVNPSDLHKLENRETYYLYRSDIYYITVSYVILNYEVNIMCIIRKPIY